MKCGRSSVVECLVANEKVVGANPIARSDKFSSRVVAAGDRSWVRVPFPIILTQIYLITLNAKGCVLGTKGKPECGLFTSTFLNPLIFNFSTSRLC